MESQIIVTVTKGSCLYKVYRYMKIDGYELSYQNLEEAGACGIQLLSFGYVVSVVSNEDL